MTDLSKAESQANMIARSAVNMIFSKFKALGNEVITEEGPGLLVFILSIINVELISLMMTQDSDEKDKHATLTNGLDAIIKCSELMGRDAIQNMHKDKK